MIDGRHYKYHKPRDEWDILDLTSIMLENKYTRDDIGKILCGNFIFRKE